MADLITVAEAQAWGEPTKITLDSLDSPLLEQIQTAVLGRLSSAHDTSSWISPATTPQLVRSVIAMLYMSWYYHRAYSEDEGDNQYAERLASNAQALITGLVEGTLDLPGVTTDAGQPSFYPNDASSALEPTFDDRSLGPAAFSMGELW